MIGTIFAAAGVLLVISAFRKNVQPQQKEQPENADFTALSAQIKKLYQISERIDMLDRMITDIEICDPDVLQKAFSCSWQSGGENKEFQFWTTGADRQAEHLMQMAADERDQLRASLLDQIDRLYRERWRKNGGKTLFSDAGEGMQDGI